MRDRDASETIFESPWVRLVARPARDGGAPHYVLETADYVCAVCLSREGELVLVRQYRAAVGGVTCELPAGTMDPALLPVEEVVERSDLLILCAPHAAYRDLDLKGRPVLDIWGFFDPGAVNRIGVPGATC